MDLQLYSHDCFSKNIQNFLRTKFNPLWNLRTRKTCRINTLFLQSNSLTITIVSQKYQDLLQPNSHDCFSKTLRTFYASRKLWIILVFHLWTLKEKLPIFLINTLLLHIPLLALTHQNYGETNTLAARGLEELIVNLLLKKNHTWVT